MSKRPWTPGPWELHPKSQMSVMGAKGYAVASCGGHADNTRDCDELFAEQQANARLIAAAPKLFEALIYARRFLKPEDHDTAFVDAALAKAKGQE